MAPRRFFLSVAWQNDFEPFFRQARKKIRSRSKLYVRYFLTAHDGERAGIGQTCPHERRRDDIKCRPARSNLGNVRACADGLTRLFGAGEASFAVREASILLTSFRQRENARPLRGGRLPAIDGGTAGRVFDGERWRGKEARTFRCSSPPAWAG